MLSEQQAARPRMRLAATEADDPDPPPRRASRMRVAPEFQPGPQGQAKLAWRRWKQAKRVEAKLFDEALAASAAVKLARAA
jgi:hypothetical protein